jgi:aryl-alcohol dehydrogenase-like predicted oxidoreductase
MIGLGTWQLGGRAYGPITERAAQAIVIGAIDSGIRWFDTAPSYGDGAAETILGDALCDRCDVQIITKVGYLSEGTSEQDFSIGGVRRSIETSLRRLRRHCVDYVLLHSPPRDVLLTGIPQEAIGAAMQEGLARRAGISVASVRDLDLVLAWGDCSAVEVICNLIDQRALEHPALASLSERGTLVVARAPLCHGYLADLNGRNRGSSPADHRLRWAGEQEEAWLAAAARFSYLISDGRTLTQAALAFLDATPGVDLVIPGASSEAQVRQNADATSIKCRLTRAEWNRAREVGRALTHVAPDIRSRDAAIGRSFAGES